MSRAAFLVAFAAAALSAAAGVRPAPFAEAVVPDDASESQLYAAAEFAAYHGRIAGGRVEVVRASAATNAVRRLRIETAADADGLGEDGFRLVSGDGSDLLVVASAARGCLYGVYEALERFGGVRWYSSSCESVPKRARLEIPAGLDEVQLPAFEMRQCLWSDVTAHPDFAARLRMNGFSHAKGDAAKYGGDSYRFGGGLSSCHTFNTLLPSEQYFDAHPEYFSMVGGRRLKEHTQLCLTNPDVLAIVVSNVLERIRADPGAKFYGVSQNDWFNGCECPRCAAVDAEEESRAGTMVRFVNAVAEAVEREFPGVLIETVLMWLCYVLSYTLLGLVMTRQGAAYDLVQIVLLLFSRSSLDLSALSTAWQNAAAAREQLLLAVYLLVPSLLLYAVSFLGRFRKAAPQEPVDDTRYLKILPQVDERDQLSFLFEAHDVDLSIDVKSRLPCVLYSAR